MVSNDVHHWLLATRWDITDLIRIQEQLQEVNQQLRMAFSVTNTVSDDLGLGRRPNPV